MSGCGCGSALSHGDQQDKFYEVLEHGGLREVVEQTFGATAMFGKSVASLHRADRAAALGLGDDVARLNREVGERYNRQVRRQFQAAIERLDDRLRQDDWPDFLERVNKEFSERDGAQQVKDLLAEAKEALVNVEMTGQATTECLTIIETSAERVIQGGFEAAVSDLRVTLQRGLEAAEHPEMGRQPASPISTARGICIAAAWVAAAVALGICSAITFCWCCFWPVIAVVLAVALTACTFID
jgi:hypothetical protein